MTATVEVHLRKRYQCSLCRKSWSAYPPARRHIFAGCLKDPATKGCPTCSHDCFGLNWSAGGRLHEGQGPCDLGLLDAGEDEFGSFPPGKVRKNCPQWEVRKNYPQWEPGR